MHMVVPRPMGGCPLPCTCSCRGQWGGAPSHAHGVRWRVSIIFKKPHQTQLIVLATCRDDLLNTQAWLAIERAAQRGRPSCRAGLGGQCLGNGGGPGGKRGQKNLLGLHSEAHRFISPVAPGLSLEVRSSIIKTPPTGGAPEARRSRPHERHRVGVSGGVQEDHLVPACTTAESLSPHPWAAGAAYRDVQSSAVPTGSGHVGMLGPSTSPGAEREHPGCEGAKAVDREQSQGSAVRVTHGPGGLAESIYVDAAGGRDLRGERPMSLHTPREPPRGAVGSIPTVPSA